MDRILAVFVTAMLVLAAILIVTGAASAETCAGLQAKINAQLISVQRHADAVGDLGDKLYAAGEAEDEQAIATYTDLSRRELNAAIADTKRAISLVDRVSAAGGCGSSRSQLARTRDLGVKSLASYRKALRSVNAIGY